MYTKTAMAAAIICALSGCTALPQSALIYSSRSTVGVSLTSNPASSSGITLSAGVDVMDAAYVPVAVTSKARDGSSIESPVNLIKGNYGSLDGKKDPEKLTRDNQQKIEDYVRALNRVTTLSLQADSLSKIQKDIDSLRATHNDTVSKLNTLTGTTTASPTDLENARNAEKNANDALIAKAKQYSSLDTDLKFVTDKLQEAKANANEKLTAAAEAAGLLQQDKSDAYSVYGRFNADVSSGTTVVAPLDGKPGPSASVALLAGKIFSTGVASQNLTEAAKIEATMRGFTQCVAAANTAATGLSDQETYKKKLLDTCMGIRAAAN